MSSTAATSTSSDNRVYEHYRINSIPEDTLSESPEPTVHQPSIEASSDEDYTLQAGENPDVQLPEEPSEGSPEQAPSSYAYAPHLL